MKIFAQLFHDDSGATAIQYGLIAVIIVVVGLAAMSTIGKNLNTH